ncbi:TetR/AcrR family transcriptional regulator [Streptomyces sp. NBC_01283]|uniref:ScbR family autoregulator-binding transcription factor n=1 Tax=Streptomyces sp. NBC_01283 TaxID=2903812 RepID=UPI00352E62B9|nr:TetR/AcrR family transcriptional regulator [Streptomyces sp. NBC_01283]WSL21348.1 TetR/AcrR family transcriptional regulator [Streptomyces sp. NBC_01283]
MVKQERAVRTRRALVTAAADGFSRAGYGPASLLDISRHAGVTSGALHFHFPTKAALASAVMTAAAQRLHELVELCETRMRSGDALQLLVDAGHELTLQLREDVVLRAGFDLEGDPGSPKDIGEVRRLWHVWISATLEKADEAGELRQEVSADQVASVVFACTVGFQILSRRDPTWVSRRVQTRFWSVMLPRIAVSRQGLSAAGS